MYSICRLKWLSNDNYRLWSPKRCDAYVISHTTGQLESRLELASLLWSHGISADVMYESSLEDGVEFIYDLCVKEGILYDDQMHGLR